MKKAKKSIVFSLLLLLSPIVVSSAYTCSKATTEYQCDLLGCTWGGSTCGGAISVTCTNIAGVCIYIDSDVTAGGGDGSIGDPYHDIYQAYTQIGSSGSANIFFMNEYENKTFGFPDEMTFEDSQGISIQSFFPNTHSIWDFSDYAGSTGATATFIEFGNTNIYLSGVWIMGTNAADVRKFFDDIDGDAHEIITVENSKILYHDNDLRSLDFVNGDLVTVEINNFEVINCDDFLITSGNSMYTTLDGFIIDGAIGSTTGFIGQGGTGQAIMRNFHIKKFNSTGASSQKFAGATVSLHFENGIIEDIESSFTRTAQSGSYTFYNVIVRNSYDKGEDPWFQIESSSGGTIEWTFEQVHFQNLSEKHTLFEVTGSGTINFIDCTFENIRKIESDPKNLTELDVFYNNRAVGLIAYAATDSKLTFTNTVFKDIDTHFILVNQAGLEMTDCVFDNSALDPYENEIESKSLRDGVTFVRIAESTSAQTTSTHPVFTNVEFRNNMRAPLQGGAIHVTGVGNLLLTITGCTFSNLEADVGGAIYMDNTLSTIEISDSVFENNQAAGRGGAIYKASIAGREKFINPTSTVQIIDSEFNENVAEEGGGAIFLSWEALILRTSKFVGNVGRDGGAVCYIFVDSFRSNNIIMTGNNFTNNVAQNSGGALRVFFDYSLLNDQEDNTYSGNTAVYGDQLQLGFPKYYQWHLYTVDVETEITQLTNLKTFATNTSRTSLIYSSPLSGLPDDFVLQHKSGETLTYLIEIRLLDEDYEECPYINGDQVEWDISETIMDDSIENQIDAYVSGTRFYSFQEGAIYAKQSLRIIGNPKSYAKLQLEGLSTFSTQLTDAKNLLSQEILVEFIDCQIGDVYNDEQKTCVPCSPGTYSLDDPYETTACKECLDNADCLGGSKIAPLPGYYRYNASLSVIKECPNPDACLGGLVEEKYNGNGACKSPHMGNVCDTCEAKHAKFGSSAECLNCETNTFYYVRFALLFVLQLLIILYGIKEAISKMNDMEKLAKEYSKDLEEDIEYDDFKANIFKILVNYVQVAGILTSYEFEWPESIEDVFDVTNKFVPSEEDAFSIDCIVALGRDDNEGIFFFKFAFELALPFLYWLLFTIVYLIYLVIRRRSNIKKTLSRNTTVLFIIIGFLVQPNLIESCLQLFNCQNFQDDANPKFFMDDDPQVECWTRQHAIWTLGIALPFFLIWGIVLPLFLFIKVRRKLANKDDVAGHAKFSFVFEGLKKTKYYWEFLTVVRKVVIVIIFVFLHIISVQFQAFLTFLTLLLFTVIHQYNQPYVEVRLNKLELISLISQCVMIYSGMFYLSGGSTELTQIILIIATIACNLTFFVFVLIYTYRAWKKDLFKLARKAKQKLEVMRKGKDLRVSKAIVEKACIEPTDTDFLMEDYGIGFKRIETQNFDQVENSENFDVPEEEITVDEGNGGITGLGEKSLLKDERKNIKNLGHKNSGPNGNHHNRNGDSSDF